MDNPFAGSDINIPEDYREKVDAFVQRGGGRTSSALHQPFKRNVDLWLFAIMLAVQKGLKPQAVQGKTYKAAEGVALGTDGWQPTALTLLAIAETGSAEVVDKPGEMMRIASGYAAAGFPILFSLLDSRGSDSALDTICDQLEGLVK